MSTIDLTLRPIGSSLNASDHFGRYPGLLVGVPNSSYIRPYISIPEGYYALVTSCGAMINDPITKSVVWSPGIHFVPPWVSVSHLVTKGYTVFDTPCKGCKTRDNVTVQIDVDCVFRIMGDKAQGEDPALVAKFVHEVTPRGLQQQLGDALDEAVRVLARSMKHRDVYGLRNTNNDLSTPRSAADMGTSPFVPRKLDAAGHFIKTAEPSSGPGGAKVVGPRIDLDMGGGEAKEEEESDDEADADAKLMRGGFDAEETKRMEQATSKGENVAMRVKHQLNKLFMPQGVQITDIMITNVELPAQIVSQLSNKTMVISNNAQEIMQQQFQMQELNYSEELKKMNQSFDEERRQENVDAAYARSEAIVKLERLKAEARKQVALLKREGEVRVKSIKANADLEVTKLVQEKHKIASDLRVKSLAQAEQIKSEADLYCRQKLSEAQLKVKRNQAEGVKASGEAEGVAAPLLRQYNEHTIKMEKAKVFESLTSNRELVLAPSDNKKVQMMCLVDNMLENATAAQAASGFGRNDVTRSQLLSEMVLMRAGSDVSRSVGNMPNPPALVNGKK